MKICTVGATFYWVHFDKSEIYPIHGEGVFINRLKVDNFERFCGMWGNDECVYNRTSNEAFLS